MKPEEKARQQIDRLLETAGWKVQDYRELNLSASLGVVVRYFPLPKGLEADYLLFVGGKAVGGGGSQARRHHPERSGRADR